MARLELSPEVFTDFDRIFDHLAQFAVADAAQRIAGIVDALQLLTTSPMIGRPVKSGKRELVIGKDSRGYVALYRFVPDLDTVFVLAVRSQRESGFKSPAAPGT
jgi:toxin ParE1/3/4